MCISNVYKFESYIFADVKSDKKSDDIVHCLRPGVITSRNGSVTQYYHDVVKKHPLDV